MPTPFALVRAPIAPMLAEPRVSAPQVSQALFGHALLVVAEAGEWRRLRGMRDGYEGWTHRGYVQPVEVPEVADAAAVAPYEGRTFGGRREEGARADAEALASLAGAGIPVPALSLGCTVLAGARRLRLPLGALVGEGQSVLAGEVLPLGERAVRFPAEGAAVAREAARWFEGTAYQWGGLTPWGADCSGFVQTLLALHGVDLPRDAWQQALVGEAVDPDPAAAAPGDLLFFTDRDDRRVTHVGLALGDGAMAHLAVGRGGWAVDDLGAPEDDYAERLRDRLVSIRRVV